MSLFFWRHNFVGWILILGGLDHLNPHDCHSFYEVQGSRSVFTSNLHVRFAGPPASMCDASADPEWWQGAGTNCGWQDSVQGSPLPSQKRNGKQHKGEPFHYCNPGTQPSQQQTSLTQSMSWAAIDTASCSASRLPSNWCFKSCETSAAMKKTKKTLATAILCSHLHPTHSVMALCQLQVLVTPFIDCIIHNNPSYNQL